MDLKFGAMATIGGVFALFFIVFVGSCVLQAVLSVFGVRL